MSPSFQPNEATKQARQGTGQRLGASSRPFAYAVRRGLKSSAEGAGVSAVPLTCKGRGGPGRLPVPTAGQGEAQGPSFYPPQPRFLCLLWNRLKESAINIPGLCGEAEQPGGSWRWVGGQRGVAPRRHGTDVTSRRAFSKAKAQALLEAGRRGRAVCGLEDNRATKLGKYSGQR